MNMYNIIETIDGLKALAIKAKTAKEIQIDIETTGLHFILDKVLTIQLGFNGSEYLILTEEFPGSEIFIEDIREHLGGIFASSTITKIGHNLLFDCSFLHYQFDLNFSNLYDTFLAEIILMGFRTEPSYKIRMGLEDTLLRHKIVKLSKEQQTSWVGFNPVLQELTDAMIDYALDDVAYLQELKQSELSQMTDKDKVILDLEMKVLLATINMRCNGFAFNKNEWVKIAKVNKQEFLKLESKLNLISENRVNNWNSNKQVKEYFAKQQGIKIDSYANLAKIQTETSSKALDTFIEYQNKSKAVSTYGESWLTYSYSKNKGAKQYPTVINGRVHCDFTQIINTGRFSCNKPNLQQIPRNGGFRECFEAPEGRLLAIADYSGQEIGIAAALSKEEAWLEVIRAGGSVHDLTASVVYGSNYTKEQRQICKNFNFGFLYGGGATTLAQTINVALIDAGINQAITVKEVKNIINKMKKTVPKLYTYLQNKGNAADELKEAYTKLGRRRNLEYEFRRYTQGMNHPIQGTGADIIKMAMVMLFEELQNYDWDAKIVLQVHDELITEVSEADSEDWKIVLGEIMEEASYKILGSDVIKAEPMLMKKWAKG